MNDSRLCASTGGHHFTTVSRPATWTTPRIQNPYGFSPMPTTVFYTVVETRCAYCGEKL